MRSIAMLAAVLVTVLSACATDGGQPSPTEDPTDAPPFQTAPAGGERTITGTFGGDAQLEGGCAWIDQGGTRWNVQYPAGYTLTLSPVRLTGPEGFRADPGETITVTGRELKDVMTTCQIGPVFEATTVTAGG